MLSIYDRQQGLSLPTVFGNGVSNLSGRSEASNSSVDAMYASANTTYYIGDQIGSARMLLAGVGWPVSSSTFYPFGREAQSSTDPNHYKFTGLERDEQNGEAGLDHAMFRQYSSAAGRWMSPDPYIGSYDFTNPQSFNRYAYVLNNPLRAVDPNGLELVAIWIDNGDGGGGGSWYFADSEDLANAGFGVSYNSDGSVSSITAPSNGTSFVDQNGNSLGSVNGGDSIQFANGSVNQSVTVSASDDSVAYDPGSLQFIPPTAGIDPNSPQPKPWKIHGNWCGPDWTGGRAGQYSPNIAASGGYAAPVDGEDTSCMVHDKCYYGCRSTNPCNAGARASCFAACDANLASNTLYDLSPSAQEINFVMTFRGMMGSWHPNEPNAAACQVSH